MIKLAFKVVFVASIATAFSSVSAQEPDQLHIGVGEAKFYPSVRLDYVTNDNVFRNPDAVSSPGVVVSPKAVFNADRRGLDVQFGYEGVYGAFDEESINFADHLVFVAADAEFGVRKRGSVDFEVFKGHQDLGDDLTRDQAGVGDEPVEYVDLRVDSSYTYGASTARFNLIGGFRLVNRSFQNRADVTDGRSYSEITPSAQISYRLSSDTRGLLQLRFRSLSFEDSSRDRNEVQLLTGLRFRGRGKLSGEAKLGIVQPDYADEGIEDDATFTIDTTLTYQPSSLSKFDLRFLRELDNGNSLNLSDSGQLFDGTLSLVWQKIWSGFVSTNALLEADLEDGGCPVNQSDTLRAELDIALKAKRWMTFGLGLANTAYSESRCDNLDQSDNDYDVVELKAFVILTL